MKQTTKLIPITDLERMIKNSSDNFTQSKYKPEIINMGSGEYMRVKIEHEEKEETNITVSNEFFSLSIQPKRAYQNLKLSMPFSNETTLYIEANAKFKKDITYESFLIEIEKGTYKNILAMETIRLWKDDGKKLNWFDKIRDKYQTIDILSYIILNEKIYTLSGSEIVFEEKTNQLFPEVNHILQVAIDKSRIIEYLPNKLSVKLNK